jgi:hypothetical protein
MGVFVWVYACGVMAESPGLQYFCYGVTVDVPLLGKITCHSFGYGV